MYSPNLARVAKRSACAARSRKAVAPAVSTWRTSAQAHKRTIAAFDRYIEWRYQRGAGTALDRREYRGLMPHTRLILTQKGGAFELSVKRRVNFDGQTVEYLAADSLQSYVTGLYRAAGFGSGHSSHSGRRTFASRLVAQGHSLDIVQLLLGHSHMDHVSPYLEVTAKEQREAIAAFDEIFAVR
jgi:integrase/recombinase XerD